MSGQKARPGLGGGRGFAEEVTIEPSSVGETGVENASCRGRGSHKSPESEADAVAGAETCGGQGST